MRLPESARQRTPEKMPPQKQKYRRRLRILERRTERFSQEQNYLRHDWMEKTNPSVDGFVVSVEGPPPLDDHALPKL